MHAVDVYASRGLAATPLNHAYNIYVYTVGDFETLERHCLHMVACFLILIFSFLFISTALSVISILLFLISIFQLFISY